MWHIKVCNKITISISRLLIYLLRISLKLTINIWIYYTLLQPVQFDILVKIKLTLYQYWFIIWYRKQSDDVPVGISEMTTSQGDNIHRVDNVYMISPGDEAAAADSMNMRNRDGRSGSNFTNVYDAVDAPQEQPNSPDPPQPTGPLYSQVVNRRQPMADIAVSSSGLYDHIQSRDGSALAIPSPENLDEPPTAPETSSMAVYSQVNKAKKRTSPHSALNGNEGAETFVNSIYEPTGSGANDTGELDLMENDLYETSEAITNSK